MSGTQLVNGRALAQRESGEGTNHSETEFRDCLESWKDIADYLRRDVRTVQRWEKSMGLPIHRVKDSKSGSVHARKSEIDSWRLERALKIAREKLPVVPKVSTDCEPAEFDARRQPRRLGLIPLLIGLVLGAACSQLIDYLLHPSAAAHTLNAPYTRLTAEPAKATIASNTHH